MGLSFIIAVEAFKFFRMATTSPTLPPVADQLYWSRPTAAQLRLLNLAAQRIFAQEQPTLAALSSSFYAVETIKRAAYPFTMVGAGVFDPFLFADHMQHWMWGEAQPARVEELQQTFSAIWWAEPLANSAESLAQRLSARAQSGCALDVLTSAAGRWVGVVAAAERQATVVRRRPGAESLPPDKCVKLLKRLGWRVEAIVGFEGARAAFWRTLGAWFEKVGWLAWSERCTMLMYHSTPEPKAFWRAASLVLIRLRLP